MATIGFQQVPEGTRSCVNFTAAGLVITEKKWRDTTHEEGPEKWVDWVVSKNIL